VQPPGAGNVFAVVSENATSVSIVGGNGAVVASTKVTRAAFHPNDFMPWTSESLTHLYYLDNGTQVRYLDPDGSTGQVTQIFMGACQQAGFAVSPDDKRIAVAIFNFTGTGCNNPSYVGMQLYIEDLHGGTNNQVIFASSTVAEYPVGWFKGQLVVAVSTPLCCNALSINPYAATSYHVANADTGVRRASLCDNSFGPMGPLEYAGVVCFENGTAPQWRGWDGGSRPAAAAVPSPIPNLVAMAPDGSAVAVGGHPIRRLAYGPDFTLPYGGLVFGWIDMDHIILKKEGASDMSIYSFDNGSTADLAGQNLYLGTLPAAIY
jgi:hypothetical protein